MGESEPVKLKVRDWHLPQVNIGWNGRGDTTYFNEDFDVINLEDAIKISASCCAQVSYRNTDMSLEKADKIFNMLIKSDVLHASCFEHLATPIRSQEGLINGWDFGITHQNKSGQLFSGNLRGWVSYRQQLKDNTCWKFDFEDRMKLFK